MNNIRHHMTKSISRMNMLCTPLVWMRIAAVATLYNPSGYVIGMMQCSIQNLDFAATAVYKILYQAVNAGSAVYNILYPAVNSGRAVHTVVYNISRCCLQSRYCRDSHPDQGCTKRVQPGKISSVTCIKSTAVS